MTSREGEQEIPDRILTPLNLADTRYGWGLKSNDGCSHLPIGPQPPAEYSGLISTTSDVARFFQALLGGELLGQEMLAEMTQTVPGINEFDEFHAGLGLFRADLPCGSGWGHGGDTGVYTNQVLASRDGSTIVVVARNVRDWFFLKNLAEEMYCQAI